jgi:general secretion pathway protein N
MKASIAALILSAAATLIVDAESVASPLLATPSLIVEPFGENATGHAGEITTADSPRRPQPSRRARAMAGNPLWAIPLDTLSTTLQRPLFSPTRRPPPPAVAGAPHVPPLRLPPKPPEPERPHLSLVGTIAGDKEGFGLFIDPSTKSVVRLKTGDEFQGWILRSVRGREVTLEKNHLTALLALPAPDDRASAARPEPGPLLHSKARRRIGGPGTLPPFTQR